MLGYLLFDKNRFRVTKAIRAKVGHLFDYLATTEGVELVNGRFPTEQGKPVSNSVQQWQRGKITDHELLTRVLAGLDALTYTSRYEKALAALVAKIVLTPELHVLTKKQITGMQTLITELSKQPVKLVITSNIDKGLTTEVQKKFPKLFANFEHFFGSSDMGVMKPNPEFFKTVVQKYNIAPEELLVIDDLPENIAAAQTDVGCKVFLFNNNPETLRAHLQHLGVLPYEMPH